MSRRNKNNRAKQNISHIAGTKSFARICRDRELKNGEVVGPIELYKLTRYKCGEGSEEGTWVNEVAKENYEKMVQLRTQRQELSEEVDEEQICTEILGFKSGYIRGSGAGPKPARSASMQRCR